MHVIRESDMNEKDEFPCPKCGVVLSPDDDITPPEDVELVDVEGECGAHRLYSMTIKHKCGQVIKIDFT